MKRIMPFLVAGVIASAIGAELPERIISGYTGYFLGSNKISYNNNMFKKMGKAGFNSVEIKIQQNRQTYMDVFAYREEIKDLIDSAKSNNLLFQIYLYPEPFDGERKKSRDAHMRLRPLVDISGNTVENAFVLSDINVWDELFHHAYQFAKLSKGLPITALKFDIETITVSVSYDDITWNEFCEVNREFNKDVPVTERGELLKTKNALEKYKNFYIEEVTLIIKKFADKLHEINPSLILGFMPMQHHWLSEAFAKSLATDTTPAIIDDWSMYNGNGFNPTVVKNCKYIKSLHKNNLCIPWFRVNSNAPDDIASQAYHAAAATDGYSIWSMKMLDDNISKKISAYALPGKAVAEDYFKAFSKANIAIRADIQEKKINNPVRIPFKKAKVLVPPLEYKDLIIPELIPCGSGDMSSGVKEFVLRNQQVIFIYAKAGDIIKITLEHLANEKRPIALQYALLDSEKRILRNEAVMPGSRDNISIVAPATGIFALVVTGGSGGLAWYSIKVDVPFFAIDGRCGAYFFEPQTMYFVGKDYGNPLIKINTSITESYYRTINNGKKIHIQRKGPEIIDLPDGIVKMKFESSPNSWCQNFIMSFPNGKFPYFFASPERQLRESKDSFKIR